MSESRTEVIDALTISAQHKAERGSGLRRAFSILLFSVFVVVDLLALVAGASSYGSITKTQQENDSRIMAIGPVVGAVRANDVKDGVRKSADAPEGQALVLVRSDLEGTYETRIYLYEGKIVEEYALEGAPYTPSKATMLTSSSTFDFSYDDGVLTVTTDAGSAKIALRSRQGGE